MPSTEKVTLLLIELMRATIEKRLKWSFAQPPRALTSGTDDLVSNFLRATYKHQEIGLYERRYTWFHIDTETSHWTSDTRMCFLSGENVTWELSEQSSYLQNLYTAARDSGANIDSVIDRLIS